MSDPVPRVKETRVDEIETIPMPLAYTFPSPGEYFLTSFP